MENNTIVILLYEDIDYLRDGLYQLINGTPGLKCANAFSNPVEVISHIELYKPDIILMDIEMPEMNGIEAIKLIRPSFPNLPILIQTIHETDDIVFEALCAGASGYILKRTKPAEIIEAIESVHNGGAPMNPHIASKVLTMFRSINEKESEVENGFDLTEKEKSILGLLVKGLAQKMIADQMSISIDTVRFHFKNIYKKLQVHSQSEAVSKAIIHKII